VPGRDGLLHISKLRALAGGKRVDNVEDVVKVGDKVQVQIAEIDPRGKLSLVPVDNSEQGGGTGDTEGSAGSTASTGDDS
jgi:polyribonucleotide nucleotidyltransferase